MTDPRELEDLLYLLRCAMGGERADPDRVLAMDLERMYKLSRFHSLAALSYTAVETAFDGRPPRDRLPDGWKQARDAAVRNALLFAAERKALQDFCEESGIWYLPLKGVLLQRDYPRLGLREMADNDILFDAAFQTRVRDWFTARGYRVAAYGAGAHDSYHKPPVFNFEMHTTLFSAQLHPDWAAYFDGVTKNLLPMQGTRFGRRMSDEDCLLYLLTHMYKHFEAGGTGLRSLLDLFVFCRAHGRALDGAYLARGLEQLGLTDFARESCELAQRIFGSEQPLRPQDARALTYYLTSGTYGTAAHRIDNRLQKLAGPDGRLTPGKKLVYLYRRVFPDREYMQRWCALAAPFFLRHRWLLPLTPWYRMAYALARKKTGKVSRELRAVWKK